MTEFWPGVLTGALCVFIYWFITLVIQTKIEQKRWKEFQEFAAKRHKELFEAQQRMIEAVKEPPPDDGEFRCSGCHKVLQDMEYDFVNTEPMCACCLGKLVRDMANENHELKIKVSS